MTRPQRWALGMALLSGLGCGGGKVTGPPGGGGGVLAMAVLRGDFQFAAVAQPLPSPVVIRVTNGGSPASGVTVTARVTAGGGSVTPTSATTNSAGEVSLQWTLGTQAGPQEVTATAGSASVAVSATARSGPVAKIDSATPGFQYAIVGRPVPTAPVVVARDAYGNAVEGVTVEFAATELDAVIGQPSEVTGPDGRARVLGWTLGRRPGRQGLVATVAGFAGVEFIGFGTPASLVAVTPQQQTANVATEVPSPPGVRALDLDGVSLAGVAITYTARGGAGRVTGASGLTDSNGEFRAGGWVVGHAAGENRVEAVAEGVGQGPVFTAVAVDAVPNSMTATAPSTQLGFLGNFVTVSPSVRVRDSRGQAVGGQTVTFEIMSGGGTLRVDRPQLDEHGDATLGSWRLGPSGPVQEVRAMVGNLPPITFHVDATPPPPSAYSIELRFRGVPPTSTQETSIRAAVARWSELIVGDQSDVPIDFGADPAGCYPALHETIDDLVIYVDLLTIDGPGGILGAAGPCLARDHNLLPVVSVVQLDKDDIALPGADVTSIFAHEAAHAMGFGALLWRLKGLIGDETGDPVFLGHSSRGAYIALQASGGALYPPLENQGGAGTRLSHWRETVFGAELMTGLADPVNLLSALTVSSLRDLGYLVTDAAADPYSLSAAVASLSRGAGPTAHSTPWRGPLVSVDRRGKPVRVLR